MEQDEDGEYRSASNHRGELVRKPYGWIHCPQTVADVFAPTLHVVIKGRDNYSSKVLFSTKKHQKNTVIDSVTLKLHLIYKSQYNSNQQSDV